MVVRMHIRTYVHAYTPIKSTPNALARRTAMRLWWAVSVRRLVYSTLEKRP